MKLVLTRQLLSIVPRMSNDFPIVMFSYTTEITLTAKDIYTLIEHRKIDQVYLSDISIISPECLKANSYSTIRRSEDSLEYYKKLKSKGWIPNTEQAQDLRDKGYCDFVPEEF